MNRAKLKMKIHFPMRNPMMSDQSPHVPAFLDRLADDADYAVVGPVDGRRRITDTTRFPFHAICHLERIFDDGARSGATGFLVAPRIVLTAAHCLMSPARRLVGRNPVPRTIRVFPGRSSEAQRNALPVASFYVPRQYKTRIDRRFDYGLIRLARPVPAEHGAMPIAAPSTPQLREIRQRHLLHISGYPGDKPRGSQWHHSERLDGKTDAQLLYSVDTCPGHSGAPIWIENWNGRPVSVIGIHTAGPPAHPGGAWGCRPGVPMAPQGMFNRGVRLSARHLQEFAALERGRVPASMVRLVPG
jgi:V8-like Glu-specific endopeptidase